MCCMWHFFFTTLYYLYFFLNATATTVIYTYGHTLPLHDALPISALAAEFRAAGIDVDRPMAATCGSGITAAVLVFGAHLLGRRAALYDGSWTEWGRSEEHTSELQSLMRISYAVFCLKKKNNTVVEKKKKTVLAQ